MLNFSNMENMEFSELWAAEKFSNKSNGATVAAITIGSAALLASIGAWVFGGTYAKAQSSANSRAIDLLAQSQLADRTANQTYTLNNQPTLKNYIDVATGGASAGANASSLSEAQAIAQILSSANNGQTCPTPVALYQPAMPCSCNTCGN